MSAPRYYFIRLRGDGRIVNAELDRLGERFHGKAHVSPCMIPELAMLHITLRAPDLDTALNAAHQFRRRMFALGKLGGKK